ncbi:uncharacterized protein LOC135847224 isoform X2 [Planococcus citri]|uniref:uncharacterized protein LOC135847224 isoform X2 n=1 Tax=Planococcus citri TaxID=170843 RepID=UPI0031F76E65
MAEITSDVFDVFHPTPAPLRELSAIVISLEIWRCEINKYRSSNTLKEFRPSGELISLQTILILVPDLPSVIYPMIDKYVRIFGHSMNGWLRSHYRIVFHFHYDNQNSVLEYFEDFVCDYDGTIHYERTAKRIMQCDQFDVHQKFLIACTYCFEDDIVRIWPLGLKKTDSLYKKYSANSRFTYWIDFIGNVPLEDDLVEEVMFRDFMPLNGPSLEYFWNRVPPESRLQKAINVLVRDLPSFVRYILPKLDHQQLDEFLKHNGFTLMYALLTNSIYEEEFVLRTWAYVKNTTSEIVFTDLVMKILECEFNSFCMGPKSESDHVDRDVDYFIDLCCEVWNIAPENLKRSFVKEFASNEKLFDKMVLATIVPLQVREFKFVLTILLYATYKERNAFWHYGWKRLVFKTRNEDLHKIMKLCLQNEDEVTEFKKNVMANSYVIRRFCRLFLTQTYFNELNDIVSFLLPEIEAVRNFKQQLLQSTFLDDQHCDFIKSLMQKSEEFDEFISEAYNDVDVAKNFKNQLVSLPSIQKRILACASFVPIEQLIKFTDLFVSNEEFLLSIKTRIVELSKERDDFLESLSSMGIRISFM